MTDLSSSPIFNEMTSAQLDFFLTPVVKADPFRFLGGLCLPIPVDAYLLGFTGIMTTSYFTSRTNRQSEGFQRWPLRFLVGWMVAIGLGTTINLWAWTAKALVVQWGTYHEIYDPKFYMAFYILGVLLVTPVHIYWVIRIWKLFNKNFLIPCILLPACLLFAVSMLVLCAAVSQDTTVMATAARPLWITAMNISVYSHAIINVSGSILTIWGFKRSNKLVGFRTNRMRMILLVAAESLALPTAFSIFVFLMYTISGRVDSAVPSMILSSKLYALCILHVLNHHAGIADAAWVENFYGSTETAMDARTNPAVLQLGALSKHGGRSRHDAYANDFDLDLHRDHQAGTDSTNNLVEYRGYRNNSNRGDRDRESIKSGSEEDHKY